MVQYRNNTIDFLKLFASYMVVFSHVKFYGNMGIIVDALARFAVPLFFLISGFFSHKITCAQIKSRVWKLSGLFVFAVIVHFVYRIGSFFVMNDFQGLMDYFKQYFDFRKLLNLVVFNVPIHETPLWYLLAILYVYLIFYFATAWKLSEQWIFIISVTFLSAHILLSEGLAVFGIAVPNKFVRNFVLMGIPFFGFGVLASGHKQKIMQCGNKIIVASFITGIIITILSRYLFGQKDLYLGSVLILFSIVALFVKIPDTKLARLPSFLTNCSAYIYIFHNLVSLTVKNVYMLLGIDQFSKILRLLHPLFVCLLTTVLAYSVNKVLQRVNAK